MSVNVTEETRLRLASELQALMIGKGLPQSHVARSIGKSDATLSLWAAGEYKGNITKINECVQSYLQREKDKDEYETIESSFVMISTAKEMFELLQN